MNENYNNAYYDGELQQVERGKKGLAVASLILSIVSVVCCCFGLGIIAGPLAIIFGIIALVKKQGGKAMSVVGIVISSISVFFTSIILILYGSTMKQAANDYCKFIGEADHVISEYNSTGELPDYIEKYNDEEYRSFWNASGYEDFDEFFDAVIDELDKQK